MAPRLQHLVFIVHGAVTLAAAIVLVLLPGAIPATVGITLDPEQHLLSYFLGAAELAIGLLSFGAARLDDPRAVRLIALTFAVFHGTTAALELVHMALQGPNAVLIVNIVVRLVATVAFLLVVRGRPS